ncbi:MAG: cation diffusion facilitator family transporter [Thermoproteota archaeon]
MTTAFSGGEIKPNGSKAPDKLGGSLVKDALFKSFLLTTSVFVSELLVGILSNSLAIISDALHASIDLITALLLLIAGRITIRPPDENHTYGHGKVDIMGGFLGAILLLSMAIYILYEVAMRWIQGLYMIYIGPISYIVLGYVLLTEILKARILSQDRDKEVMRVGFVHNLADAGGTIVAISSSFLVNLGFPQADLLASVALSGFIMFASVKMLSSLGLELSDAISRKDVIELKSLIAQVNGHEGFKDLRMRRVGDTYYAEVTIFVKPDIKIEDAHNISEKIEKAVSGKFGASSICTVHIEPSSDESAIGNSIREEARNIKGLRDIHSVRFGISGGVAHITLHANVDGSITLEEAHEIADEIERRLSIKFGTSRTFVHLEPFEKESISTKSSKIDLEDLQKSVINVFGVEEVNAIDVYELEGKRYFEICVKANRSVSLETAHRIASEVEELVKSKIGTGMSVEVHVEPN